MKATLNRTSTNVTDSFLPKHFDTANTFFCIVAVLSVKVILTKYKNLTV